MSSPTVSILLPVFEAEATLEACLRSISRQTERDWECVAVDDGSTDRSPEILRCFADRDSRFRSVPRPHEGIVAALNAGLAYCRGPLVARMDADDLMHGDRLRLQRAALHAGPALAGVGAHTRLFPRACLGSGMREYEAWLRAIAGPADVARDAFVECPLAHPTWLVRREVFEALPYRDRGWPEDYDWLLRAQRRGLRLGVVPRRLLAWRATERRLSRRDPRYGVDRFVACKAHHLARSFLQERDDYILWGYGQTGRALRSALAAEGKHPTHIVELHPGRLGNRIHGAPVIEPATLRELAAAPIVVSVAGAGPRAEIRAALSRLGRRELRDFRIAA